MLYTFLETDIKDRNDLIDRLCAASDFDNDFIGENGEGYLWDVAKGFNSNRDYVIDLVKDYDDEELLVNTFFETWMEQDWFYIDYRWKVKVNKGKVTDFTVSIAI